MITLTFYCVLIVLASLIGGRLPQWIHLNHNRMQILISFVGGLMLGIAVFHMIPHAVVDLGVGEIDRIALFLMLGMLVMFFLLRTFHFHHHDLGHLPAATAAGHEHSHEEHQHGEACDHHHHHSSPLAADMSWMGVFVGLSLHTLIDGMILGASIEADLKHTTSIPWLPGLGIFLAILLHKPLDALSITSLMQAAAWPAKWQLMVNAGFALMCPLGAALFMFGVRSLAEQQTLIIGCMLAFAGGVFLCISLSDLLPEMELHSHHRIPLSIALLLGVALAYSIRFVEPDRIHVPQNSSQEMIDPTQLDFSFGRSTEETESP